MSYVIEVVYLVLSLAIIIILIIIIVTNIMELMPVP
jgi:hypothetical protein